MVTEKGGLSVQTGLLGVSLALSIGLNCFQMKALAEVRETMADLKKSSETIRRYSADASTLAFALHQLGLENRQLRDRLQNTAGSEY
jgi:hypothetical protein